MTRVTGFGTFRPTRRAAIPPLIGADRDATGHRPARIWGTIVIDSDGGRWLTYREAAAELGLSSPEAVRSLARRRGWSRRSPNAIGDPARVFLPTGADRRSLPAQTAATTGADRPPTIERPSSDSPETVPIDQTDDRTVVLAVEVKLLRDRIADKDTHLADLRQRLDVADRRIDELQAALSMERRRVIELLTGDRRPWWRRWFH